MIKRTTTSSTKRTVMSWMLVATVFATTAAACGSDDDKDETPTTQAPSADTAADSGDNGDSGDGGDGGSSEAQAFCDTARAFAAEYEEFMADPTSGDAAALGNRATELTTQGASLAAGATPEDAQAIQTCLAEVTSAMTGG